LWCHQLPQASCTNDAPSRTAAQELQLEDGRAERVVVEVDGRSRFSLVEPYLPLGALRLRRRLLRARGWRLVSVPFYEWEQVAHDATEQEAYLRRCLTEPPPPPK
jgi:hypothetical protein